MDFIIQLLASLFSKFKAKNPLVATILLLVFSTATHTIHQGNVYGLYQVSGGLQTVLEFVTLFLTAATGSQTFQYLGKK